MASIEPIDDMEDVQMEEWQKEKEKVVDLEQPTNAEGKQENKKQETVEGGNKVIRGKRCKIASIIVAVMLIVAAIIIIGVVFGRGSGNPYQVDVQWQAQTWDGWSFGFVGPYATSATVKNGGEAWDDNKEFKIKLNLQGEDNAVVKAELHQSGESYHVCCAHELQAGVAQIDSGFGEWGGVMSCKCLDLWYDHQIRAKVSTL